MKKIITSLAILIIGLFIATSVQAIDSTVAVTGNTSAGENQPGWMFGRDLSNATPFRFVMSSPSIGVGSLYVEPIALGPVKYESGTKEVVVVSFGNHE